MSRVPESPATQESLSAFLDAVRPPLDFLANAAAAAGRTQFPGRALAGRGRKLAESLGESARRRQLEELCGHLESYEEASAERRLELVVECRALVARLSGAEAPAKQSEVRPPRRRVGVPVVYRGTEGDVSKALEELARPVQFVRGVGPKRAAELGKFGIDTLEDLLYHLPFRYEDRRRVCTIAEVAVGQEAGIEGEILQLNERVVGRAKRRILEAVLRDSTGLLGLTWYHQVTYFKSRFRRGQRCLVYGRVERDPGGQKRIVHPDVDLSPQSSGGGILPVYNKPTAMSVTAMRKLVGQAMEDFAVLVPSVLPASIAGAAKIGDLSGALRAVHRPAAEDDVDELNQYRSPAHRSLVFDELFFLQLGLCLRRRSSARETGLEMTGKAKLTAALDAALPFALTAAQRRVIGEIATDMAASHPMHRLVQGDVGSGKTVVGLYAALIAIENGRQAAFMAPTELLAEQHFRTISGFAEKLGVRAELLTGDSSRAQRGSVQDGLHDGTVQIAVGTHALIQESVEMPHLGTRYHRRAAPLWGAPASCPAPSRGTERAAARHPADDRNTDTPHARHDRLR